VTGVRRIGLALFILAGLLRGSLRWYLRPAVRQQARERAKILLRDTGREPETHRIARAQVLEQGVQWQLSGHYRWARDLPVEPLHHLADAHAEGKGVVVLTAHTGWTMGIGWRIAAVGFPYVGVGGGWVAHGTTAYDRRQQPMFAEWYAKGGGMIVTGTGAFAQIQQEVEAGGIVGLALDMPGSLEVSYLGKTAFLGNASFRVPWLTGCPVQPAFMRRDGLRLRVELLAPLWPRDHADYAAWCEALARTMSDGVLSYAHHCYPRTPAILWPGGDATASRPNRQAWAERLASGSG
jgi:hypothetical protein